MSNTQMWNSGVMTTSSKSGRVRDVAVNTGGTAVKAAKLYSAGPAVIGFRAAKGGVGMARRKKDRRRARRRTPVVGAVASTQVLNKRSHTVLVFASLVAVAAATAVIVAKRRSTVMPPSEAPPSLDDYADTTSPVNGSSAQSALQ